MDYYELVEAQIYIPQQSFKPVHREGFKHTGINQYMLYRVSINDILFL